jgi:hypothetical protein
MPEKEDVRFERMNRTMEFILEQQAQVAVHQAQAEERAKGAEERHNREMAKIERTLRRATALGAREARNQRMRRHDLETRTENLEARYHQMEAESKTRFERIELLNAESTEKLNALIQFVDGLVRRGRWPKT